MSNFYDNLNVNGDISIRNSTTGNTFYINQLGSGNAVLIEDSASPDLTPFIINSSGNVNIGRVNYLTTSGGSSAKLQVNNSTSTIPDNGGLPFDTNFIVQGFNQNSVGLFTTDINYSQIYFGTPANTFASNLRWDYTTSVLSLSTQDSGGTISINSGLNNESIKILQNGNVGVGISAPSEKLEVSGNTKINGTLNISTLGTGTTISNLGIDSNGFVVSGVNDTDTIVTGFTYSNNNFTISQDGGQSDLVANISTMSGLTINGDLNVNGQTIMSASGQSILTIIGSGDTNPLFTIQGSSGELFSVTDSLVGSLFSVNDISGLPILEVFDDDTILMGNYQAPSLNTTVLSNPSIGLSTIYSVPMSAYTGAWFEYTVKNTSGVRAGQIMSIFSGNTVNFTEITTTDIGTTSDITFNMSADSTNTLLQVSATTVGWEVKTIVRSI